MTRRTERILLAVVAVIVGFVLAVVLPVWNAPAEAESITLNDGRYQYISLDREGAPRGEHFAIFDSQSGTVQEWNGKSQGEHWTYGVSSGREMTRRSITAH